MNNWLNWIQNWRDCQPNGKLNYATEEGAREAWDAQQDTIDKLEADNAKLREANDVCTLHCMEITGHLDKLREAADRVAFEAEADDWSCMPSIQACKKLAAALEGE